MTPLSAAARNDKVLAVLAQADEPLGPTEIARRISEFPRDGLVHAPWFRDASALAEHLNRVGHVDGGPAFYLATK